MLEVQLAWEWGMPASVQEKCAACGHRLWDHWLRHAGCDDCPCEQFERVVGE